jgi:hypothetical protein
MSHTTYNYSNSVKAGKHIPHMVRRVDTSVLFFEKTTTSDFAALMDRPHPIKKRLPNSKSPTLYAWTICRIALQAYITISSAKPNHTKIITLLFFVYFGTHNNKVQIIYKQTSVIISVFPWCSFGFISKAATTKKHQFIYDLYMLCLGPRSSAY